MNNNLPQNWSWVKLGDVVDNFKRGPFGSAIKKSFFVPKGYKVYEQKNAIYNSIELGSYFIDEQKFLELQGFEVGSGDFIVSCSGTIGKIYRLPPNAPKGVINQALLRIRLKEKKVFEKYFLELFKSYWFQKKMLVETRGSAMLNIAGVKELKQIPIPLPPLPEQKKIVEKIEELFSGLDSGVASLKKSKVQLRIYRQSVLAFAFSGRLIPSGETSKDKSQTEMLKAAEPRAEYANQLPEGWKWVKLGELTHINPKLPFEKIKDDTVVTFLPMKRVEELSGKFDLSEERKYSEVKKGFTPFTNGDVIFAKITPCMENGKIAVLNNLKNEIGFGSTEFHVFRTKNELVNQYLFYFLIQDSFRAKAQHNMSGAVGQKRVPKRFIAESEIPLSSLTQQLQIVEEIESRFAGSEALEKAIDDSLAKAESLRQSILKQAFEGKLV